MATVTPDEVLLLGRALRALRSGRPVSHCPLYRVCPRWSGPDDYRAALDESPAATERRRAAWPCSRLLEVLDIDVNHIGHLGRHP
jgi:hypothetical protein